MGVVSSVDSTRLRRRRGVGVVSSVDSTRARLRREVGVSSVDRTVSRSVVLGLGCVRVRLRLRLRVGRDDSLGVGVGETLGVTEGLVLEPSLAGVGLGVVEGVGVFIYPSIGMGTPDGSVELGVGVVVAVGSGVVVADGVGVVVVVANCITLSL